MHRIGQQRPSGQLVAMIIALACLWSGSVGARAKGVVDVQNGGFEQGEAGSLPTGWFAPSAQRAGFTASMSVEMPHRGKACMEIRRGKPGRQPLSIVRQTIDATQFRGHRVRLSGWLRFRSPESDCEECSAGIWMRTGGHPPSYEDTEDNPVRSAHWTFAQVVCEVASDADSLTFGAALNKQGGAWFDDLQLAIVGRNGDNNEAPRILGERGIVNLVAFGRLLGYVRHFHPSDEATRIDWGAFAIAGIQEVEGARTAQDLRDRLERLFQPIAPTVRLSTLRLTPLADAYLRRPFSKDAKTTGYRHMGWPSPTSGTRPRRIVSSPEGSVDSILPIGSEVNADLGGGVWCSVPLTLYRGDHGTVPRGKGRLRGVHRPDGWVPTGNDRSTRLADVILLWNVLQHFYPYFDKASSDWLALLPAALREAATDSDGVAFEATLRRLTAGLHDGHASVSSRYTRPANLQWPFAWSFVGDRLVLTRIDRRLAKEARLGDEVIAIQGRSTSECVREATKLESGATLEAVRSRAVWSMLALAPSDTLTLMLRSPAGEVRQVQFERSPTALLTPAPPDSVSEIAPGVMYLDLRRITDEDLRAALPRINMSKGVIFDMRGYPQRTWTSVISHLVDSPVQSPGWGTPVVVRPDHVDTTCVWTNWVVDPELPRIRVRTAFLIDGGAMSAAETLLSFVEAYHLGDLVGEPTAGTNGNVTSVFLPGGYSIPFTGIKVLKQDGSPHHGIGILPTVPVTVTPVGLAAGQDEQLDRAVEIIQSSWSGSVGKAR
jgi:hypothetical protein